MPINYTFFVGDFFIPNLNNEADLNKVTYFINKYEPECLMKVLGYPLFRLIETENSQRMTDLLQGAEYTDGQGDLRKWQGLVYNANVSLIAAYIYFKHQESTKAQTTGVGTVIKKPEGGFAFSPADKMSNAWNFFSREVHDMTYFLWIKKIDNVRVYPEFTFHQYLETRRISRKIDSIFEL